MASIRDFHSNFAKSLSGLLPWPDRDFRQIRRNSQKRGEGMETITIKDVARICGVGVSTVSRAINNHPDINPETKEMIMQVIREHDYVPNNSARNLKRSDARAIAILIKGISNPFFNGMIKVFEEEIQKKKYTLVLQHVDEWQDETEVALELEKEKRLRGIVFLGGFASHSEERLKKIPVPFVLSTVSLLGEEYKNDYSFVSVNDVEESYRMTDYLIRQGHEKIAILCSYKNDVSIGALRLAGYQKALAAHHIPVEEKRIRYMDPEVDSYSVKSGYSMTRKLLEDAVDCTAIFALSDSMAIGAVRALIDAGKRVPEDISVAGFDGTEMAAYYNPIITTLRQPAETMARETIKLLFDSIKKKTKVQQLIFEGELVPGESVKKLN